MTGDRRGTRRDNLIGLGIGAFLIANVVFGMTYSIIDLQREASEARDAQKLLLGLGLFAHSEATEMTLGIVSGQTTTTGDEIAQRIDTGLGRLPDLPGHPGLGADVRRAVDAYFDSVEATARALADAGAASEIAGADEGIESARLQLDTELEDAAEDYADHAADLDRTANVELVVMMTLVIIIVGLLMRRAQRLRQSADLQAFEQERRAEARFRSLVQNSSDAILILGPNTMVRFSSPSVERVLGLRVADLDGSQLIDVVHKDDSARVLRFCYASEGTDEGEVSEFRLRSGSDSWLTVEASRNDLRSDPTVGGIVLNLRDVTEQKHLESQVRQSQKMEAVGQLAGGVAHDFNNLLTIILGNVGFLEQTTPPNDPKQKDIAAVREAAERAQRLTRQLLIYSRKELVTPEVLDPNRVLSEVEKLIRPTLPESIELAFRTSPDLKRVRMDSRQLEQVVMNLVVNARDAMPDGGRLLIDTANVTVDEDNVDLHPGVSPGQYARITVSDTGHGIDEATRARIFEPFFTSKPRGSGTGLGLATVYAIAKRFDGHVFVHSEVGAGTSFMFYLPATDMPATNRKEPERIEGG